MKLSMLGFNGGMAVLVMFCGRIGKKALNHFQSFSALWFTLGSRWQYRTRKLQSSLEPGKPKAAELSRSAFHHLQSSSIIFHHLPSSSIIFHPFIVCCRHSVQGEAWEKFTDPSSGQTWLHHPESGPNDSSSSS